MKVAIVTQGNTASGAEVVTAELYSKMKSSITVLSGSKPLINFFRDRGFNVQETKGLTPLNRASLRLNVVFKLVNAIFRLRKQIKKVSPNYIHVYNIPSLLYTTISCLGLDYPIILHVHDFYSRDKLVLIIAKLLKNKPKKIIAVSDSVHSDLIKIGFPPVKIRTIHNGIFLPEIVNHETKCSELITVGFVGSISHWKGLHVLLDAAKILDQKGFTLKYIVVGPFTAIDYEQEIRQSASEISNSDISFLGKRNNAREIMRKFDILVHCSIKDDPFPTVLLEGMFNQCAVIGSKCGGVPEIIRDHITGLLHSPGSSESLAKVMEELIVNNSLRKSVAQCGYEQANKLFTLERYQNEFFDNVSCMAIETSDQ